MNIINNLHGTKVSRGDRKRESIKDVMRFTPDIGMFTIDRSREDSCVHKTDFCDATCFNIKLERVFKGIEGKDVRNDEAWANIMHDDHTALFSNKRRQTQRVRLMSRGEAFKDFEDIQRVQRLAQHNPNQQWWIPTRAWRDTTLWKDVERLEAMQGNLTILASVDPSNTQAEWEHLKDIDRSIMFYGDDEMTTAPTGERMFLCPKTHKGLKGHCSICKGGCFKTSKRVVVHLSQH